MAVVLGTSSGFVTVAPTADPAGTDVVIDGASVVTKDTSPATAFKITEIGWYRGVGTDASNFEVALYAEAAGIAATRLFVDATNSDTAGGWVRVPVNWLISGSTAYWLAVQMDAHSGSSDIDSAASGGSGIDRMTSQTTLASPYGGGVVADADGMYAIYALWVPTPAGAATQALTATFTTAGTTTSTSVARISLAAGSAPKNYASHAINVRARVTSGAGTLHAALYEGANNRSGELVQTLTTSLADYSFAISAANAATITDYSNLEVRVWGHSTTAVVFEIDQVSLTIPEAALAGAATSTYTSTFTTQGTKTTSGAATQALALGSTTVAKVEAFAASTQALTATLTTQGAKTTTGAATQALAATLTTQGAKSSFGAATQDLAATFTTQGVVTKSGAATQDLAAALTTQGTPTKGGAATQAITTIITTQGVREVFGSATQVLIAAFTTAGVRTVFGSSSLSDAWGDPWGQAGLVVDFRTAGTVDVGIEELFGAATQALTFTATTTGTVEAKGAATQALSFNSTTAGLVDAHGAVVLPLTFNFTTQGAQQGIQYGATSATLTLALTTVGSLDAHGAIVLPLSTTQTTQGLRTTAGAATQALAFTFTTQGVRAQFGAVVLPLAFTSTSAGVPTRIGQVALTLFYGATSVGLVTAQGVVVLPLTLAYTAAGSASVSAQLAALNLSLGITTLGTKQGSALVMLPPVIAGHIAGSSSGDVNGGERIRIVSDERGMVAR